MKTVFDINVSDNTRANFTLLVAREAVRSAVISAYAEIRDEGFAGGVDEYNRTLSDSVLEDDANEVRESQGHNKKVSLGKLCALADAAHDELADLVEEMKASEPANIKGILYYHRDLRTTIDEVFKREWEAPQEKQLGAKAIEKELDLQRQAYGSNATVQSAIDALLETKRKIGVKYRERFDEVVEKIEAYALANRQIDCASFEALYRSMVTREQNARHVQSLVSMLKNNVKGFQQQAFEKKWSPEWAGVIVLEKRADIAPLEALKKELSDSLEGVAA